MMKKISALLNISDHLILFYLAVHPIFLFRNVQKHVLICQNRRYYTKIQNWKL